MNIVPRLTFISLAAALMFTGCAPQPGALQAAAAEAKPRGARLSAAEAIRIAKQAAERHGADLPRYQQPEAHYEFTRKDKTWFVSFHGRVAMPGNHFSVYVDDRTGETRFFGGR
jgi:hypothetical protein